MIKILETESDYTKTKYNPQMPKDELLDLVVKELQKLNNWDFGKTEFNRQQLKKASRKQLHDMLDRINDYKSTIIYNSKGEEND